MSWLFTLCWRYTKLLRTIQVKLERSLDLTHIIKTTTCKDLAILGTKAQLLGI